jgi:hypothetical protein
METSKFILALLLAIGLAFVLFLGYKKFEEAMFINRVYELAKKVHKTDADYQFVEESSLFTKEWFVKGSVISVDNGLFISTLSKKNSLFAGNIRVDSLAGDKYEILFVDEKYEVTSTPKNKSSKDRIVIFTPKNVYSVVQQGKFAGFIRAERN